MQILGDRYADIVCCNSFSIAFLCSAKQLAWCNQLGRVVRGRDRAELCGICICLSKRELFTELLYEICQQLHLKSAGKVFLWCVCGCAGVHMYVLLHMLCHTFYNFMSVTFVRGEKENKSRRDAGAGTGAGRSTGKLNVAASTVVKCEQLIDSLRC